MQVSRVKAVEAFVKVKRIREHWGAILLAGDRDVVSIEEYQRVIADMYGLTIEKRAVSFEAEHLRGMVERYGDRRARILIRSAQPLEWKRFTTAKELTHLVIDEEEDWSVEGAKTLDRLIYEFRIENGARASNNAIQSEALALYAAIEIVYPYDRRLGDIKRLDGGEVTRDRLALEYVLPSAVVARAIHPEHMAVCASLWADANKV